MFSHVPKFRDFILVQTWAIFSYVYFASRQDCDIVSVLNRCYISFKILRIRRATGEYGRSANSIFPYKLALFKISDISTSLL